MISFISSVNCFDKKNDKYQNLEGSFKSSYFCKTKERAVFSIIEQKPQLRNQMSVSRFI